VADFDHDGTLDLLVTTSNDRPLLYRNLTGRRKHWLEIRLAGTRSNRNAIGARVRISLGKQSQIREVNCGNGYASQSSLTLHFGLGAATRVKTVEIFWPSGFKQTLNDVRADQILSVREGDGPPPARLVPTRP
jgi:hypothetical protein